MADETVDLRFLAGQGKRILDELGEIRGRLAGIEELTKPIPQLAKDVSELQIAVAATRADLTIVKNDVDDIKETARLIEGRLVRLEKHAGFAKA